MDRPRIALLYSGAPRDWRPCVASHRALFPDADVDVYAHFWDTIGDAGKTELLDAIRPVAWRFDPPPDLRAVDEYAFVRRDSRYSPSDLTRDCISQRHVATLFAPHMVRYDLAVRLRADLYFFDRIGYDLEKMRTNDLSLLGWWSRENPRAICDLCAIGKPREMLYWHSVLDYIWSYAKLAPMTPESLLMSHLAAYPVKRKMFMMREFPFMIRDAGQDGWTAEECRAHVRAGHSAPDAPAASGTEEAGEPFLELFPRMRGAIV